MPAWDGLVAKLDDAQAWPTAPAGVPVASVAAIFAPDTSGASRLLLMQRAARPGDPWAGHIGLPGGRAEPGDVDAVATAIRETEEEVGIVLPRDGLLRGITPRQARRKDRSVNLWVHLFAFSLEEAPSPGVSDEVDAARWIPVADLLDQDNAHRHPVDTSEGQHHYPAIRLDDWTLWGLTWWMLKDLLAPHGLHIVGDGA